MSDPSINPLPVETVELVRRAHGGERSALDELFARYAPRVRGLVAVRMGQSLVGVADREDIVQESLTAAFRGFDRFEMRSEGSFICWLAAVVHGRIANAQRAAAAEKRKSAAPRAGEPTASVAAAAQPSPAPSPSAVFAATELDPELERALLALPAAQRDLVYCRLVLEMTFAEIAASLEPADDVDRVRARFHKAMSALRTRLA